MPPKCWYTNVNRFFENQWTPYPEGAYKAVTSAHRSSRCDAKVEKSSSMQEVHSPLSLWHIDGCHKLIRYSV